VIPQRKEAEILSRISFKSTISLDQHDKAWELRWLMDALLTVHVTLCQRGYL
jgi:hypothetical protein